MKTQNGPFLNCYPLHRALFQDPCLVGSVNGPKASLNVLQRTALCVGRATDDARRCRRGGALILVHGANNLGE